MGIPESLWISMKQPDIFHGNFRDFPSVAQVAQGLGDFQFYVGRRVGPAVCRFPGQAMIIKGSLVRKPPI